MLHDKVTHFLLFLRKDKYVNNCPASVYRIRWIKEKFPQVKTIVWPYDLDENASVTENLVNLAKQFIDPSDDLINKIKSMSVPQREAVYKFPIQNGKEKVLLIGVVPHSIDPYRKTDLMDYLTSIFDVYSPINFSLAEGMLEERGINDTIYFKEKAILHAIEKALEMGINKFILVSDPLDLPGTFTFPIVKEFLNKNGVFPSSATTSNKAVYIELVVSHKNHIKIKEQLKNFSEVK